MLRINITTQPIHMSVSTQNAQSNLHTTLPAVRQETTAATLEIRQPRGELTIDMTPCRYSIGLKNNTDFARDNAAFARQTAKETVDRIVQEGNQLAQIETKADAIVDIAASSTIAREQGITLIRIAAPEIHYKANPVQLNPTPGKVNYTFQPATVQGNYQPGSVDIQVSQYPSIEISTVDVKV